MARREYAYDPKHFSRVPAPGHGGSIHNATCQARPCQSHMGTPSTATKTGTSAEAVWRESVGLSR